jgi:hypothetical protein
MLLTVAQFRDRVAHHRADLIRDLQQQTGRYGDEEKQAWDASLRQLSRAFQADAFKPLHLYFGSRGSLSLEYQLPASSSWCDAVLLGAHESRPSAVIIELKNWQTRGDEPGSFEGLMRRQGVQALHPSDQVRGYSEYCRRFHSAVQDHHAAVHGCVLGTRDRWTAAYSAEPNRQIAEAYPLFSTEQDDIDRAFPSYFADRLTEPNAEFARAFENGGYRQQRGFVAQIGAQILDPSSSPFELLDGQRTAFAEVRATVQHTFVRRQAATATKRVVIVKGPPGSGKSAIAARLWASLVTDNALPDGDVVLVTTSTAQNDNWTHLFDKASEIGGAWGAVRKATAFTPITTQELGRLRKRKGRTWLRDGAQWKSNLQELRDMPYPFRSGSEDDANLVSIVDEAHALINPEHNDGRGQHGFAGAAGPQAYHIIRASRLSVFLLDPLQGFRQQENTNIEDIRTWSRELGAGDPVEVSLEGMQFRCAGSTEYVRWAESLLSGASESECAETAARWHASSRTLLAGGSAESRPTMDVRVFDEPFSMEAAIRERITAGSSARLVSSYSRPWNTKGLGAAHHIAPDQMDFHQRVVMGGATRYWSRIWNYVPDGTDYAAFVSGHRSRRMQADPLSEVGCPYVVRGFDYDYVGMLWLDDLVWRNGRWRVQVDHVHETGISRFTSAARREQDEGRYGAASQALLARVAQAYRILLTRGLKGVYLWVSDDETRAHLRAAVGIEPPRPS